MSEPMSAGATWSVVFTGIIVVFAILVVLVFLCSLLSMVVGSKGKAKKEPVKKSEPPKAAPAPAPAPVSAPAPVVEEGIPGEVVAAISAAVACMMGPDKPFAVRSVKRARESRPAWNAAGIAENTRPF